MDNITWHSVATGPLLLGLGRDFDVEASIQVEPGTGDVQVQLWSPTAEDWYTPAAPEYTISVAGVVGLKRANQPPMRILATGDAQFAYFGARE